MYKTSSVGTSYYVYDEQGQLLGEYDANGVPVYETIYLGSTPVGVMKQTGTAGGNNIAVALHDVYADQIDTPRVITKQDHTIVWRWDTAEAFGATAPDQDPSGLGVFVFNQRFPGQVADAETGLNQNWNREYSARGGRYESSDPIGLRGGMNTFLYGDANPLSRADSTGLASAGGALGGVVGGWIGTALGEAVGGPAGALAGRAAGARLGSALGSAIEDDCQCVGGYVRLYRVVGEAEYRSISSTQQYSILPTGFSQKQFWFRMGDAKWFAEVEVKMDPTAGSKPRYIISSKICNSTLRQGASFSDVGHQAISFDNSGLPYVNRDASVTGGIRNVAGIPVVK
ncbi:MAG TPA: RHS repeat-associated core domain-containing protein [Candidatus Paceibacterota bacterium]|nr:RHS repeat-associated core domain-containing protein [Candidatus Paceibacterota bacterium]